VATPVTVPSLGDDVPSAVLIRFLVEADGVLLAITATPGVDYLVGATIGWIGEPGEDPPA